MLIETLSTFPHMYDSVMGESMMKRAQEKGILEFRAHDLRDWTHDRHRTTDDDPYGGGAGLVMKCDPIFEAVEAILGKEFVEAKLASAMGEPGPGGLASSSTTVEFGGDVGCPDRASSAANETAQWAVSQSEDCLSESGYPPAPPQETSNQIPEEDPHPEFAHIRLLMGAESYYLYDDSAMTDAYARWAFLAAEDDPVATFIECVREESSVYPRPMARESLANDPFRMKAEAVEAAFAEARAQGRADDIERVEASNGDVYFYSTTYLTPRRAQALAEWDAVERIRNV